MRTESSGANETFKNEKETIFNKNFIGLYL